MFFIDSRCRMGGRADNGKKWSTISAKQGRRSDNGRQTDTDLWTRHIQRQISPPGPAGHRRRPPPACGDGAAVRRPGGRAAGRSYRTAGSRYRAGQRHTPAVRFCHNLRISMNVNYRGAAPVRQGLLCCERRRNRG